MRVSPRRWLTDARMWLHECSDSDLRNALLMIVFVLSVLGLVMIFSASSMTNIYNPDNNTASPELALTFFRNQLIFVVVGFVCIFIIERLLFTIIRHEIACWFFWLLLLASLVAVNRFGITIYNAKRWLALGGTTVQPSEFAKVIICILAAVIFTRYLRGHSSRVSFSVKLALGTLIPLGFIFLQPDLGTTVVVVVIVLTMFIAADIDLRVLAGILGVCVLGGIAGILLEPYRLTRLMTVFDPWSVAQGEGYQTVQGFIAMGTGGFFGVGLGNSVQKLNYLPISYTDFIFAIIGEELGFLGCVLVLVLFGALATVGFEMVRRARNDFARLVIAGSVTGLIFQALLNIMCVAGLFPVTGKPLPFISAGGSSLISSCMLVGLILAGSRYNQEHASPQPSSRRTVFSVVSSNTHHDGDAVQRLRNNNGTRLRLHQSSRATSTRTSTTGRTRRSSRQSTSSRSSSRRREQEGISSRVRSRFR